MPTLLIDAELRATLIEHVLEVMNQAYVFPEVAAQIERDIRAKLTAGAYTHISEGEAFRDMLTTDIRAISGDKHVRLLYHAEPQPPRTNAFDDPAWLAEYALGAQLENYGVASVERMVGNIGLLDLREFHEAPIAGDTLIAAMRLLAHTHTLIIDLRENGGGDPATVALLCSFFVAKATHVNSFYNRANNNTQQFWSYAYLPGPRYLDRPVYILTSVRTFSAAEEFAYDMQVIKRATVVGEQTPGGAHPVDMIQIHPHFDLRVPIERAINPITGTNWEGVGVTPDVVTAAENALDAAYRLALHHVVSATEGAVGPLAALHTEAHAALKTAL